MEVLKLLSDWIWALLGIFAGLVGYHYKKLDSRISDLEKKVQELDKHQAAISIELKSIKEDIVYIRSSLDKLIDRLYEIQ